MKDKYIFLDRDGVINKDPAGWTEYSYVTRPEDLHILAGVKEAIRKLTDAGYKVVIISNQQGVGKGYFTRKDLDEVTRKMLEAVKKSGGDIAGVYYCVHAKEEDCDCRKPKPGLFLKAREEFGIGSFTDMFYIGDTERDIQAGQKAGLKTILVLSGKASREDVREWGHKPDHICRDLPEAVEVVLSGEVRFSYE